MRAAVYLRISNDREGRGLGVERQRADCLRLADQLGVDVVEVYLDDDTRTAMRVRPAYRRLLADAGADRFGTVIAHTSGRLAEHRGEYEDLIELARRHGTRFAYVMSAFPDTDVGSTGSPLIPLVSALGTFRRLADDLAPDLRGLVADAAPAIEPLAEGVAGFVRNVIPGLRGLVRQSAPVVTDLSRSLPPLGHAVGAFLGSVSPGVPGASALVSDVVGLASGQALFWGGVIRRLSQSYLAARGFVGDTGDALAALPQRTRHLVLSLFDEATTAIGIGIGSALRSHTSGLLSDPVRQRFRSLLDAGGTTTSTLVGAATAALATLPARIGTAAGDLTVSAWGAATLIRDEVRGIVSGAISGTESAASIAMAIVERAVDNILLGAKTGLSGRVSDDVAPCSPIDRATTSAIGASVGGAATPGGITVDGFNINLYGSWDPGDPAAVDRVAAGIYEALNRYRPDHA